MSSKVPLPPSSPSSDPALLQVTEAITGTHDAKAASGIADMLLIFLSAAGTILGALLAAMVYVLATASRDHTGSWIVWKRFGLIRIKLVFELACGL